MEEEKQLEISIVVPVYNEEESINDLVAAITSAMEGYSDSYEVVLVDDGSTDKSFSLLRESARNNPQLRLIRFGINYGQTAALAAGFHYARGKIVVTMDADLQNDPTDIPELVRNIHDGWDVVS